MKMKKAHADYHLDILQFDDSDSDYTNKLRSYLREFAIQNFNEPDPELPRNVSQGPNHIPRNELWQRLQSDPHLQRLFQIFEREVVNRFESMLPSLIEKGVLEDNPQTDSVLYRPDLPDENADEVIEAYGRPLHACELSIREKLAILKILEDQN